VRVFDDVTVLRGAELVAPDVIAQVGSAHDVRFGEVDQVAIERRPVETLLGERFEQLGMTYRRGGSREPSERGNTRTCASKSRFAKDFS